MYTHSVYRANRVEDIYYMQIRKDLNRIFVQSYISDLSAITPLCSALFILYIRVVMYAVEISFSILYNIITSKSVKNNDLCTYPPA